MPAGPAVVPPSPIACYYLLFGVVGTVFADWNALALGRILNQQGAGLVT